MRYVLWSRLDSGVYFELWVSARLCECLVFFVSLCNMLVDKAKILFEGLGYFGSVKIMYFCVRSPFFSLFHYTTVKILLLFIKFANNTTYIHFILTTYSFKTSQL